MDLHQKVGTGLGTAIIVIFAVTAAVFSFKIYGYQMAQWASEDQWIASQTRPIKKAPQANNSQLANPASVFCEEHGGKLEIRTGQDGGQFGICRLDDGKECEEWSYMRGECPIVDMSTWKTYRNEKYGLEFNYPSEWKLVPVQGDFPKSSLGIRLVSPETEDILRGQGEHPGADIIIEAHGSVACFEIGCSNKSKDLLEYLNQAKSFEAITEFKEISINGMKAYETDLIGMGGHHVFYFQTSRGVFSIDFTLKEAQADFLENENGFLHSLRLIK